MNLRGIPAAQIYLSIPMPRTSFWRYVYKENIPHRRFGKIAYFAPETVEAWFKHHTVTGPKDLARLQDGRRSENRRTP